MEPDDIRRVRDDWVRAAKLVRDAGFDIVYVYGGHSYLPLQFLSPFYNQRTDAYGGSLENRARFWLETLEAVRDAVGDDCAIAVRFCVDALGPAGVELDEGLGFIRLADHLVDLWDVNVGSIPEWSKDSGASRFFAEGYQLEWTGRVREATAKPIVGVGRLTNPDRMAEIVESGAWDLIGAARPSISDPFLPEEDRGGTLRRGARVHRLQRLRAEGRGGQPHRLHAERDRGRGVPPRLAPGALRAGGESRPRRARRRRRARRGWSARSSSASAASAASTSSRPSRTSAASSRWVPQPPRARRVGPGPELAHRAAREARQRRGHHRRAPLARRTSASTAPRSSSSRRARDGRRTASTSSPTSRSRARMRRFRTSSRRSR